MPHLFDPLSVREVTLRNRVGLPPMCMYSAEGGMANDWHVAHLGARAAGGTGLIIMEATAVEARGRITAHDLGLWHDGQIEPLRCITALLKEQGSTPGVQIAHAGRKASSPRPWGEERAGGAPQFAADDPRGWQVVGPSALAFAEGYQTPHELTAGEIHEIVEAFAAAARRARAAGFEWVEIHGAHGYLIHSFLSPLSNKRTDGYGGDFGGRARFVMEVAEAVRGAWPQHLPLGIRLSCTDWTPGGWTLEECVALAKELKRAGVDLVDCSSGGNVPKASVPVGPGYQVPLSEAVRQGAGVLTAAVGLIHAPSHADEIIRNGRADLALVGRAMLRDPYWPVHAARELGYPAPIPGQYLRGY